jgi:PIN domain nuclease of toxin-antitoxin system
VNLLLDTHAWVFVLSAPERLSAAARVAIDDPGNDLCLSPISVWETILLARKGRLALEPDPTAWVQAALAAFPTRMLPLTHDIAVRSHSIPGFDNLDPADRFLIATCLVHDLSMVTADNRIRACSGLRSLW